jgi:hypothetical protein
MMHNRAGWMGTLLVGAILGSGCAVKTTNLQIESFKQTPPQVYSEHFENGVFAIDPQNNWDLIFEVPSTWVPTTQIAAASQPETVASDQGEWSSQVLHIKVFWTPRPGRTYAESTQTNAAIRYYLFLGKDVMCYDGAGFVYFRPPAKGKPFVGRLESASLNPVPTVSGAHDLFGPCRLTGDFVAAQDLRRVKSILQSARRRVPVLVGPPK